MRDHSIYIWYSQVKTYKELYNLKCPVIEKKKENNYNINNNFLIHTSGLSIGNMGDLK